MITVELEKNYRPELVESRWYLEWEKHKLFSASVDPEKKPYCIVIPPPNITGTLHMGHALNNTIQDILIRTKRMQGFSSLWIPGTDHAGIATQRVVEKELLKEGTNRWELGREKFLERVWEWSEEYRKRIVGQLKRMGCSCDWDRERFTLDDWCSRAVREAFVRLYDQGLIYRGKRIINWCTRCHTALSDLEVEHEELVGKLYYLHYPCEDGSRGITIATTRPETILADTAVAVHPDDARYRHLVGKHVILPIVGRKLPVIADDYVQMDFGTGGLKITPAHDPNDFEVGERHNLPIVEVIDEKGIMNDQAGKYEGMDRFECRKAIVADLEELGSVEKIEDYNMALGTCYRCHSVIEPYLSEQWFVRMKKLVEPAIKEVERGNTKFFPERFATLYLNWMANIKDWCISRQLWWGHRVPVWTCERCGHTGAYLEDPTECLQCGGVVSQDEFVLDTWFSSGLWPFSTMGWPDKTPELSYFYPTSVLSTARDIIYLWVSRMMMFGLELMGSIPFHDVFIHATVLNKEGRRMSKSLGTGVDPLELFDKYGTDATRFGLAVMTEQGQDIKFSEERMEMSKNFANKIWNASRYILKLLPGSFADRRIEEFSLTASDRWILSKLNSTTKIITESIESYQFDIAAKTLYSFFWDNFCDWYVEITKPILYGDNEVDKERTFMILEKVLQDFLTLAHPIIPFITEEIRSYMPGVRESREGGSGDTYLITAPWPEFDDALIDPDIEQEFAFVMDIIKGLRNMRAEANVPPQSSASFLIETPDENELRILRDNEKVIGHLSGSSSLSLSLKGDRVHRKSLSARVGSSDLYMPLEGLVDIDQEIAKLEKEQDKIRGILENLHKKLENPNFVNKAKSDVVDRERGRLEEMENQYQRVMDRIALLKG